MGIWGFYFFVKIFLNLKNVITLNLSANILFAFFLIIPLPEKKRFSEAIRKVKGVANLVLGFSLLWHDSYFPSPYDIYETFKHNGLPSTEYIYTFLIGYYSQDIIFIGAAALIACMFLAHYIKIMNVAILFLLLLIPYNVSGQISKKSLDEHVEEFFDDEEIKSVSFSYNSSEPPDFDIIFLHICSLSWDDLYYVGLDQHPIFKEFNYLFENFNSVTAYSGPAMIRLMNAACGQKAHTDLYSPSLKQCHIFQELSKVGFDISIALNHNGRYGQFSNQIIEFGHVDSKPMSLDSLESKMLMFDNSPVYDDFEVLNSWLSNRMKNTHEQSVFYYNSVSLHDGVHAVNEKVLADDTKTIYTSHLKKLLDEMRKFIQALEDSGRKFIVVFIPEHGMSIKGSKIQKSTLRDIPLPDITRVPVGIKLIGGKYKSAKFKQHKISKPTSYLAIAHMLSMFIEKSPFASEQYSSRKFIDSIPISDFVAENDSGIATRYDGKYFFKVKGKNWVELKN